MLGYAVGEFGEEHRVFAGLGQVEQDLTADVVAVLAVTLAEDVGEHLGVGVVQVPDGTLLVMLERRVLPTLDDVLGHTLAVHATIDEGVDDALTIVVRDGRLGEHGETSLQLVPLDDGLIDDTGAERRVDGADVLGGQRQFGVEARHAVGAYETQGTDADAGLAGTIERVVCGDTEADNVADLLGGHLERGVPEVVLEVDTGAPLDDGDFLRRGVEATAGESRLDDTLELIVLEDAIPVGRHANDGLRVLTEVAPSVSRDAVGGEQGNRLHLVLVGRVACGELLRAGTGLVHLFVVRLTGVQQFVLLLFGHGWFGLESDVVVLDVFINGLFENRQDKLTLDELVLRVGLDVLLNGVHFAVEADAPVNPFRVVLRCVVDRDDAHGFFGFVVLAGTRLDGLPVHSVRIVRILDFGFVVRHVVGLVDWFWFRHTSGS